MFENKYQRKNTYTFLLEVKVFLCGKTGCWKWYVKINKTSLEGANNLATQLVTAGSLRHCSVHKHL